jgi:hypothetical protein
LIHRCERGELLDRGRAVVVKRYPFTIQLRDHVGGKTQPVCIKIDPGSKTTGIAVVTEAGGNRPSKVLCLFELQAPWPADQRKTDGALTIKAAGPGCPALRTCSP